MAWRNQGMTGSNNIPLGNRRRFGGGVPEEEVASTTITESYVVSTHDDLKRGRSPVRCEYFPVVESIPQPGVPPPPHSFP